MEEKRLRSIDNSLKAIADALAYMAYGEDGELTFHELLQDISRALADFEEKFFRQPVQIQEVD